MYLRRDECTRTVRAPAKLNIYLDVLGRRADGFHELETLIVPVRWWDSLGLATTPPASGGGPGQISLTVRSCLSARDPPPYVLPPDGDGNLVIRALKLLRERSGCAAGARVELIKRIPMAAGLGGGSSDAAAALSLANRTWGLGWRRDRLLELGAEVGSDVPFFLGSGAAICRGRGERVEPLTGIAPLHFVIIKPPVGLDTANVYRAHDALAESTKPHRSRLDELVSALRSCRYGELGRLMMNRLEAAAATLVPWIERVRRVFEQLGCLGHQLSGSGSSYFGVCRHAQQARRLVAVLRARQLGLVCATCSCQ
jgi:4-diphosphocytidyl-2-C-methyl-D-erythritol kinase